MAQLKANTFIRYFIKKILQTAKPIFKRGTVAAYLNLLSDDFQIYGLFNDGIIIWVLLNDKKGKYESKPSHTFYLEMFEVKLKVLKPFWREVSGTAR